MIQCAASDIEGQRLFVASSLQVVALDRNGMLWRSRRVSFDGVKMLAYDEGYVKGIGLDLGGPVPIKFLIDASTGEATGGFDRF